MPQVAEAKPASARKFTSEGFFVPEKRELPPQGSHEKIVVVSDLHGSPPEVLARLDSLAESKKDKPKMVIFQGDVAGNKDLEDLQRLYYNHLTNRTRNGILQDSTQAVSDEALLNHVGKNPPKEGYTVRQGFLDLRRKELELQGVTGEALEKGLDLSDETIAAEVRRYREFVHYGHYASNLPKGAVETLTKGIEKNASALADKMKKLQDSGVDVVIVEGNWDPSPPIAFERDTPEARRLPREKQPFNTAKFFRDRGIKYFTDMAVEETDTAAFVLLPFDQLVRFADMDLDGVSNVADLHAQRIKKAKEAGKQVIVVQHGEAFWEPHHLNNPDATPKGEHAKILDGVSKITPFIEPDEVLYGHFHDPLKKEDGTELEINTKYAQRVVFDATPVLVPSIDDLQEGDTVVSYMKLQSFATVLIPYDNTDNKRKVTSVGGRAPAEVTPTEKIAA